jgi:4-diphosphocytidyl-2-C-methyl-D-erythritol kinase
LRLFNEHWALGLDATQLRNVAAEIGSDCPFFLDGGVQLAGGRGEVLKSMPLPATSWLCIVRPPVYPAHKTQMLYSLLRTENWSDGSGTEALAKRLKKQPGCQIQPESLCNVFDRVADAAFGDLGPIRSSLRQAGAKAVHLCGAGPSLYGLFQERAAAECARSKQEEDGLAAWVVWMPYTEGALVE